MSLYAAQIEDGIVVEVIVGDASWAADALGGVWKGTDAKVSAGWTYDDNDGFRPPQPYPSWSWDGQGWQPPVPYPDDEAAYAWDEDGQVWVNADG